VLLAEAGVGVAAGDAVGQAGPTVAGGKSRNAVSHSIGMVGGYGLRAGFVGGAG
jgi:hypothetical protein